MAIVFFCQSCGSRFEVDSKLAGKRGHCKNCGQMMSIPRAEALASMVAMPAPAMAAAAAAPARPAAPAARPSVGTGPRSPGNDSLGWLKTAATNVGLSPLTIENLSLRRKPQTPGQLAAAEFDREDSKPYNIGEMAAAEKRAKAKGGANQIAMHWRREVGMIQKIFRWFNNSAYFVSIPFIMILILGAVGKSRSLALFGATFVVLLNIGRGIAGLGVILLVPLRDGLDSRKLKKPMHRVVEPVLTIAAVFALFTFLPWLSSGNQKGSITERLESEAKALTTEMKGEVKDTLNKAKNLDVKSLEKQAESGLNDLQKRANETLKSAPGAGESKKASANSEAAIDKTIRDVGKQAKEVIDAAKGQP